MASELYTERKNLAEKARKVEVFLAKQGANSLDVPTTSLTHLRYELDRYLALEELQHDPSLKYRLALRQIRQLGDYARVDSMERKYQKASSQQEFSQPLYFLESYLLRYEKNLSDAGPVKGPLSEKLTEENDLLDRYYLLAKLRLACHQAADNLLFSQVGQISYQHFIIEEVKDNERWLGYPLIQLY
ncbi:MAG: hypothetical protein AAGA62_05155, partial [Bacteroidota bacterium]